jgi:MYXO-CTERM domain-containing protein
MPTHTRSVLFGWSSDAVLAMPVVLLLACSAETGPPGHDLGEAPPGALRGELVSYVATRDDGTSDEYFTLRQGGEELRLEFDGEPGLDPGALVDVWGAREGGAFRVRRFAVLPVQPIEQPLNVAAPFTPRSFVLAIVRIGGTPTNPLMPEVARQKLVGTTAGTQPSVRQYYVEASYGRQDIAGEVVGPFEFPMTGGCMTSQLATALRPMIPGSYNHYLWYMEPRNADCSFSGLASGGTPTRPARDTWYNGSSGCVVLMQEPGHNFGMRHSSFMKCPGASFVDAPDGTCTHNEYGDRFDPMGSGCRHMNAYQKASQGWLDKCNLVDTGASGTFTLLPLELPCDGVQALSIKMPRSRPFAHSGGGGAAATDLLDRYYVELRSPLGIDKGLMPTVQIRVGGDVTERNRRSLHTWFLDMDPTTTAQDGLAVGATFTDPSGSPRITLVAMDASRATVKVEFDGAGLGAPVCLDGTPFEGGGPGPESCAAAPAVPAGVAPTIPDGGAVTPPPPTRDGGMPAPRSDAASMARDAEAAPPDSAPAPKPVPRDAATGPSTVSTPDAAPTGAATAVVSHGCGCALGGAPRPAPALLLLALLALRRRKR